MQSIGLALTGNIIMTFPLSIAHDSYLTIFLMFSLAQHLLEAGYMVTSVRGRSALSDISSDISPSPLYIPPHRC